MPTRRSLVNLPLALAVAALLAVAACGGSSNATKAPATDAPGSTPAEATAGTGTGDLSGATGNFSKIDSFKFKMVMSGGSFGQMLGSAPITGTVTMNPKAAQMSMMGIEMVEIGGKSWIKMGDSWTESTDDSTSSLADSFSPEKMFGSTLSGSAAAGYKAVGEEQKNGVATVHYTADASLLNSYSSLFGVKGNATWSADAWVAKDGGYPVSMSVKATGGDTAFEMTFDITNINDPSNKIESPV